MALRGFCILIGLLASIAGAVAGEDSGLLHRASCPVVRYYVVPVGNL